MLSKSWAVSDSDSSDTSADALDACAGAGEYVSVCRHSVMDASSGAEQHHAHDEGAMSVEKEESWFQKIINFILSLFRGSDDEGVKSGPQDMVHEDGGMISEEFPADEELMSSAGGGADAVTVVYRDNAYIPETVQIFVGDTVTWVNESSVFWPASNLHPTHKNYPGSNITKCGTPERLTLFDACEAMGPGAEYSFTFNEAGEWDFHDHINPRATGVVIVSE